MSDEQDLGVAPAAPGSPLKPFGHAAIPNALTLGDALRIALGCTDYGGGYRGDAALYEAYQAGIQTVIAALAAAASRGLSDIQVCALYMIGNARGIDSGEAGQTPQAAGPVGQEPGPSGRA